MVVPFGTMVHVYVLEYVHVYKYIISKTKHDLKYKHSGATGTLPVVVGVVSIEDITVYYS